MGIREHLSRPAFEASWVAQHLAYGAAAGVAYALADRRFDLRLARWSRAPLYGTRALGHSAMRVAPGGWPLSPAPARHTAPGSPTWSSTT